MATALITGASRGFGAALANQLVVDGWDVVVDARDGRALDAEVARWSPARGTITPIAGDVADPGHRQALVAAVRSSTSTLELLVNNASTLGPSPLPPLAEVATDVVSEVLATNTLAPLALVQALLPELRTAGGTVVNISSDAAVEPYEGWGVYGASKAALDQLTAILGAEEPTLAVYAFDPGDMRTAMHQAAFPGEDISDRPEPITVVPALRALLERRPVSGRYRASDLLETAGAGASSAAPEVGA